ncbi:hypothetical protein FDP41_007086 [Naegleria fowleri]|uniref:Cullin-4 n=1 Tax=Naegleria fowleri TaxID=5763 RepID=A0A6A5BLC8_NAEFO|nr:uncharacterized protein FDP41_007086 [Naegleria fowleri]KAF0973699.1 hypothetical protein FDP41_007086 [Naegleria fowleri]CAG4714741.1 unnamed protein product [Naegleria fowleri]
MSSIPSTKKRKQQQTSIDFTKQSDQTKKLKPSKIIQDEEDNDVEIIDITSVASSKPKMKAMAVTSSSASTNSSSSPNNNNNSTLTSTSSSSGGFTKKSLTPSTGGGLTNNNNMTTSPLPSASQKKKILKIKPFTIKPTVDENFEEETWNKLKSAVIAIQQKQSISIGQEELYQLCSDLCRHKKYESTFNKLKELCSQNIESIVDDLTNKTPEHTAFLNIVVKSWEDFTEQLKSIRSIFLYLERSYVVSLPDKTIWDMGLKIYRECLKNNEQVGKKIISGILYLIQQERNGESIDRSIVQRLVRMLMALQLYEDYFEKSFLEETRDFYSADGLTHVDTLNPPEYLLYVETRLRQESERVNNYLSKTTKRPLIQITEHELIKKHAKTILEKGFYEMMESHRIFDLSRLYGLLRLVDELELLKEYFTDYMKAKGSRIVKDEENEKNMVQETLQLKSKVDELYEQAFHKNEQFMYAIRKAFEHFLNLVPNKPSELIAKYIDSKLKSGNKGLTESELERCMDNAHAIVKYIHGKDIFEAFYKKDLAKRLLLGRCASYDAERIMIAKLKTECGPQFTNKLEGMFKDVDISNEMMANFKKSKEYKTLCSELGADDSSTMPFELNVTILTSSNWPNYTPDTLNLPKEISLAQEAYKDFYVNKHSGRVLKWIHSLGQCTLKSLFPSGRKELLVSFYQALTLLQFNNQDKIPYTELKKLTGIEDAKEFMLTMQSLTLHKVKVLRKERKGTDIKEDDVFFVNDEFTHPLTKIKVNSLQLKETKKERAETTEKVLLDRSYVIDAAIVRIMKARKTLTHQQLLAEVLKQIRFPTTGQDIKKRIESLIDRDYLERDTNSQAGSSSCTYHYVA